MAAGLGLVENRPLTDSPEKTPSLSALCASNESSLEDERAVKFLALGNKNLRIEALKNWNG